MRPGGADAGRAERQGAAEAWSSPDPAAQAAQRREDLRRILAEHDAVNTRWLDYELDVGKMIDYPMMSDVREPLTVDFLRAKRAADGIRPDTADSPVSDSRLAEYRNAVHAFGLAFDIAEREARRIRDRHYSEEERSRLSTARKLANMAEDAGATPAERQSAYKRVRRELDGLLELPDATLAELERRIQGVLKPGSGTETPA
jgi:hypothetical protein